MLNAATQTFLGDRSADLVAGYDANLLGTAGSVAFGLSGLDFYKDLSDIAYGLENWENTPGDYLNLGANLIALIPVIGAFKNLGKPATDAASNVAKRIDDEVANLRAIGANNRSAPDFHNNISQRQPGGNLPAPARVNIPTQGHHFNQIGRRGWTNQTITETVQNPFTTRTATNRATGNPATVYYNRDGSHVIVDNVTRDMVQISDRTNIVNWIPDSSIVNPYIPPNAP